MVDGAECGWWSFRSERVPGAERGTTEQWRRGEQAGAGGGSGWQVPAGGAADGEAALFESLKGEPEAGVVDAQALPEHGPGEGLAGAGQSGAHRLGERGRRGGGTVDEQREGLVGAASEAQQERERSGARR